MAPDRFTKVFLAVLAIGVWVLALAYVGTPAVLATDSHEAVVGSVSLEPVSSEEIVTGTPAVTYPLRWYVSLVHHEVIGGSVTCKTVVMVANLHSSSVDVAIQFFDDTGTVLATPSGTVAAGGTYFVGTDELNGLDGDYPTTGTHLIPGHARVYATHPKIIVSDFIECPTGAVSVTNYPVGATADFFQASLPGTGVMPRYAEIVEGTQSR